MMTIYWVPRAGYGARGAGQAGGKNSPKLGNTLRASCRAALNYSPVSRPREGRPLELQTKVREDFTIMEKAFSFWLKAPVLFVCVPISHLQGVRFVLS